MSDLYNDLSSTTSKQCSEFVVSELVRQVADNLKDTDMVFARICGANEYSSILEKNYEHLGSSKDYGDDPHDDFVGPKVYMFNLTSPNENFSEETTDDTCSKLSKRLNTFVSVMHNVIADRVNNGEENASSLHDFGIVLSVFDKNMVKNGKTLDLVSTKKSTYTKPSGVGTMELTETVMNSKFLHDAKDIICGFNFYSELQHRLSDKDLNFVSGNPMLKKFIDYKVSENTKLQSAKVLLSKLSPNEQDNYEEIVSLKKDGGEKIYDWFTFLPNISQNLLNVLVSTGVFDANNPKLIKFASENKLNISTAKNLKTNNVDDNFDDNIM